MNELLVYIDHNTTTLKGDLKLFVDKLKRRIISTNKNFKILTYEDIHDKSVSPTDIHIHLENAARVIKESYITISIIDDSYLDTLEASMWIVNEIENIIKEKNRFFFPVIFENTHWLRIPWLVPLTLYPNHGSVQDLSETEKDNLISEIVSKTNIISQESKEMTLTQTLNIDNGRFVFISHSHSDSDFAELLKMKLEKNGIKSWMDTERLKIGQDWRDEIDQGIKNCLALIVIMSPEARNSEYVTYEWSYAWGREKHIFPIMLKQTSLHPRLESLQYLNFTSTGSRPYERLFDSIKKIEE